MGPGVLQLLAVNVNIKLFITMETTSTAAAILEKKGNLEEELRRVERQIYELEGEYLQARARPAPATIPCYLFIMTPLTGLFSVFLTRT